MTISLRNGATPPTRIGRQPVTTHGEISRIALDLFIANGFENTSIEDIAAAAGVSRRTIFRYFPSKNDLPWGDFTTMLQHLHHTLRSVPPHEAMLPALRNAIIEFNTFPEEHADAHRQRMHLLIHVPALAAHATLKYEQWRAVIAEFVAARTNTPATGPLPQTTAWTCLGICLSAYEQWLAEHHTRLPEQIEQAFTDAEAFFSLPAPSGTPDTLPPNTK